MEVLAVASTVCAICNQILKWMDQVTEKETLLRDISSNVLQIKGILSPFTHSGRFYGTGEEQLSYSISGVGDVLRRIDEHLRLYRSKKTAKVFAFLNPNLFVQKLKNDQLQLSSQLVILLAAIATVGYFRDHANQDDKTLVGLSPSLEFSNDQEMKDTVNTINGLFSVDAQAFWKNYIGMKVEVVSNDLFCTRLVSWYNSDLCKKTCDLIIMRLDEFNSGVVTLQNVGRALGEDSLKDFVETYRRYEDSPQDLKLSSQAAPQSCLRVPLLVWVDDRPENNYYEVRNAREMGIEVIELPSTAAAKVWVDENAAFLREHDTASKIRYISDNVRLETISESHDGLFLNASAGQNLLQYLRGRLFNAPVLVYTFGSINKTGFVTKFDSAGSTIEAYVCLDYIASLAAGLDSDSGWKRFRA